MVTIMDGVLIKGENKVMKLKTKLHKLKMMMMDLSNVNLWHLTQEYIKWFKEIILWTTFLEASKEG
jgi:chromatin segregation and condensation protein Rec8/ScpA/Scc1 (kleisin family)